MKILVPVILIGCATAAYAADGLTGRVPCGDIMAQIEELSAKSDRSAEEVSELKSLRMQYSTQCQRTPTARRGNARSISNVLSAKSADALNAERGVGDVDSFLKKKQENCRQLSDAIEKLKSADEPDTAEIEKMQAQYDADCVEKPAAEEEPAAPEEAPAPTPEEEAARIAELIAKGLCADGTKPNKYGCCTGEKFKDLGNLQFACCKEDTDECFPPME